MAELFIAILRSNVKAGRFTIHDFVVMPNHVHILMTIPGDLTVEKAMRFIKGGFSYRARKELEFPGEVWQRGFSDVRVVDEQSFYTHRAYINNNPVEAGLAIAPGDYPFGTAYLKTRKRAAAKAQKAKEFGTTEVVP